MWSSKFKNSQVDSSPVFVRVLYCCTLDLFRVYVQPKISEKLYLKCILYQNFNSFNFQIWVAVGVVVVHAGSSAASDCAMVRKVRVTNGMQELRTEEDSLELRQVGSW